MFYKLDNDNWESANKVRLPSGKLLTSQNKSEAGGWEWHETPPKEYLDWKINEDLETINSEI